jgi:hypothetical protein
MTKIKEKIKTLVYNPEGTQVIQTLEREGTVYKKKNDAEWAHYGADYFTIRRDSEGKAELHVHPSFVRKKRTTRAAAPVSLPSAPVAAPAEQVPVMANGTA